MSPNLSDNSPSKFTIDAKEIAIERVTVFRSSSAQVVRNLTLDLKAGSNLIEIVGLSSSIETESLRVSGLGNVRLADVVCDIDSSPRHKNNHENEDPQIIEALDKISDLKFEKEAYEAEVNILLEYAKSLSGALTPLSPAEVTTFVQQAVSKKITATKVVRNLKNQIRDLEKFLEKTRRTSIRGLARATATITVVTDDGGPVHLTLSYIVGNTRWTPTYDLHATSKDGTPSPSVWLHYRVLLSQCTGEHWNNASLIFSTSNTNSLSDRIPEPKNITIETVRKFAHPRGYRRSRSRSISPQHRRRHASRSPARRRYTRSRSYSRPPQPTIVISAPFNGTRPSTPEFIEHEEPLPVYEGVAFVTHSPLSVTYTVDDKPTIPSDGKSHKVSVAQLPFEAEIMHVTVPRVEPLVYLQCQVENTTNYHLLPGPVSVFMDEAYVSKTSIPDINTGDIFRCTLGLDTSTRVSHSLTSVLEASRASSFVEQYNTTTYKSTTVINNRHTGKSSIAVVEKSSVPVSPEGDTAVKVILKQPKGLAEAEDDVEVDLKREDGFKVKWNSGTEFKLSGKKDGQFMWMGTVAPGQEVTLVSEWEVRAPVDVTWTERSG